MLRSIGPWRAVLLLVPLLLPACAESQLVAHGLKGATASTAPAGTYKIGKPYQIEGVWYYPAEDWSYDETGIASWYGPQFHGKQTANGETFDQNEVTAAHRTLPLPVLARVTNLENGRSLTVRVNDRGPYAHGRIIDLSRRSAQLLGFEGQGMAKVRVQILADESKAMIASLSEPGSPNPEAAPQAAVTAEALPPPPRAEKPRQESLPPPPGQQAQQAPQQARPAAPAVLAQPLERSMRSEPVRDTRIYVQAGSFSRYDNANRLTAMLSGLGQARIMQAVVNGKDMYRVRLGPYDTVDVADRALESVIRSGHPEARIIVD